MINIEEATWKMVGILKSNAPVRTEPPSGPSGSSPYPGNLMNNGINGEVYATFGNVKIGGDPAPYGPYTETKSHKKGWIQKSVNEFTDWLTALGGQRK